ncbi:hypothetical protein GF358_00445 [Candidatus Woesearchaeota archaeon]|nr:hypothetical protein [Candidatus Woesearchaeota archaeon]
MVKEAYNKIKKKYKILPDYDELNIEFEIGYINNEEFLLREIRRKMNEKFIIFMERLCRILQPEGISIVEFYEFGCLTKDQKAELFNLLKELRFQYRRFINLDLILDYKEEAKTIRDGLKFWKSFRKKILPFFELVENCWAREYSEKEILKYLG